jgi:hypothetical protein
LRDVGAVIFRADIPLSQAPVQLRNAMNGDLLKGIAANH